MKNQNIFRQGDVLVERIDAIPAGVIKQKPKGRIILAHGEATGHHHSIDADAADWWKGPENRTTASGTVTATLAVEQFIKIKRPTALVHQEHAPVKLPPGNYRVTRQREYSPEAIRNVAD